MRKKTNLLWLSEGLEARLVEENQKREAEGRPRLRLGHAGVKEAKMSISKRFWSKVIKHGSQQCREWCASYFDTGYGMFTISSWPYHAHRVAWWLTNGPIPEGMGVLHHCDNPKVLQPGSFVSRDSSGQHRRYVSQGPPKTQQGRTPRQLKAHRERGHGDTGSARKAAGHRREAKYFAIKRLANQEAQDVESPLITVSKPQQKENHGKLENHS